MALVNIVVVSIGVVSIDVVSIGVVNIGVVSIGVVIIGVVNIGVVIGRSFGLSDGSKVRNFDKSFCVAARNSKMRKN